MGVVWLLARPTSQPIVLCCHGYVYGLGFYSSGLQRLSFCFFHHCGGLKSHCSVISADESDVTFCERGCCRVVIAHFDAPRKPFCHCSPAGDCVYILVTQSRKRVASQDVEKNVQGGKMLKT